MLIYQITQQLDEFFKIGEIPPDSPFNQLISETYSDTGIKLEEYMLASFFKTYHGLMICNGTEIIDAYSTVFLSEEILSKIFRHGATNSFIISHHPLVMETGNRGFLPLSERYFKKMIERNICVYVLHTPLDVHDRISTGRALARILGLKKITKFYRNSAISGHFDIALDFIDFLTKVSRITGVNNIHYIKKRERVRKIGIIPGGTDTQGILETINLGCDTLLTGVYYNQVNNEVGKQYRDDFDKIKNSLDVNLVECSHYASESIVMKKDIIEFFQQRFGLRCNFIPQEDPWY